MATETVETAIVVSIFLAIVFGQIENLNDEVLARKLAKKHLVRRIALFSRSHQRISAAVVYIVEIAVYSVAILVGIFVTIAFFATLPDGGSGLIANTYGLFVGIATIPLFPYYFAKMFKRCRGIGRLLLNESKKQHFDRYAPRRGEN